MSTVGLAACGIAGVHGPFEGVLADGGERLLLSDALGRPVDEVHYRDDGSWPAWADGDGPSLELVDLRAESSVGSAWLESEHEAQSEWASYEYSVRQVSSAIASDCSHSASVVFAWRRGAKAWAARSRARSRERDGPASATRGVRSGARR